MKHHNGREDELPAPRATRYANDWILITGAIHTYSSPFILKSIKFTDLLLTIKYNIVLYKYK